MIATASLKHLLHLPWLWFALNLSIKSSMKDKSCTIHSKNILQTEYFSKVSMEHLWVIWLLQPPTKNRNQKCVINWSGNNCSRSSFPEHVCSDLELPALFWQAVSDWAEQTSSKESALPKTSPGILVKQERIKCSLQLELQIFLFHLRIVTYKNDLVTTYSQETQHTMVGSLQKL